MKNVKKYLFIVLLLPVAFAFQNCQEFESNSIDLASTPDTLIEPNPDGSNPDEPAVVFLAGQAVDSEVLPFNVSEAEKLQIDSYIAQTGYKAIAFADNGEFIARSVDSVVSQEEANRMVLEICQLHNDNRPCAIFAEGNTVKYDEVVFSDQYSSVIEDREVLDISMIPALADQWKTELSTRYPDPNQDFDALATNGHGGVYRGWSNDSQDDAEKRALEFCEAPSDLPCVLYASANQVILDLDNLDFTEKYIPYAPEVYSPSTVPFIQENRSAGDATSVLVNRLANGTHFAIAISRYGHWAHVESETPITQVQLDNIVDECTATINRVVGGVGYQHLCFVYAVDGEVVLTREVFEEEALGL